MGKACGRHAMLKKVTDVGVCRVYRCVCGVSSGWHCVFTNGSISCQSDSFRNNIIINGVKSP